MKILEKVKMAAFGVGAMALMLGAAAIPTAVSAKVVCSSGANAGLTVDNVSECGDGSDASSSDYNLMKTVNTIINVILGVIGLVAVVVVILGGVQYITSQGDPAKTKKAKDTILYGIIGLVVALLAFAIVNFVLSNVFSDTEKTGLVMDVIA